MEIHDGSLMARIAGAHQIMETDAGKDDECASLWSLTKGREEALEPVGQDAEGVLDNMSGSGEPVVEDAFIVFQSSSGVGLHHGGLECERFFSDEEERRWSIIRRQVVWLWDTQSVAVNAPLQLAVVKQLRIRTGSIGANLDPHELVVSINQSKKDKGEIPLVVVIQGSTLAWLANTDMLPIEST
jgi:hypothetical protein